MNSESTYYSQKSPTDRFWPPQNGDTRGVIAAIHGMGGSPGDFAPLADALASSSWATHALTLRGMGMENDPRLRGDCKRWDSYYEQVRDFVFDLSRSYQDKPLFLVGESMGAILSIHCLARFPEMSKPLQGLIMLAPVNYYHLRLGPVRQGLFNLATRIAPALKVSPSTFGNRSSEPRCLCRDEAYALEFANAPHRVRSWSVRFYDAVLKMIATSQKAAEAIPDTPVLLIHGGNDTFIRPRRVETFFNTINSSDKERVFYEDAMHLLLRDPVTPDVISRIEQWVNNVSDPHRNN